jgi:DUF1680 family protein
MCLWNWRMFLLTGESKYADIVELALYNSVLSGVSMDGSKYFYTNPLAATADYPYHLRWEGGRVPYISKSNCCPPNVVRTIAEVNSYLYSIGEKGLYINMYGGNVHWQLNYMMEQRLALSKQPIIPGMESYCDQCEGVIEKNGTTVFSDSGLVQAL